jgi:hypothetical protein
MALDQGRARLEKRAPCAGRASPALGIRDRTSHPRDSGVADDWGRSHTLTDSPDRLMGRFPGQSRLEERRSLV